MHSLTLFDNNADTGVERLADVSVSSGPAAVDEEEGEECCRGNIYGTPLLSTPWVNATDTFPGQHTE